MGYSLTPSPACPCGYLPLVKYKMIWRMHSIRFLCRITYASWILHLRASGSELVWTMTFDMGVYNSMVLGAPSGYPLEDSISMLLGLAFGNSFGGVFRKIVWQQLSFWGVYTTYIYIYVFNPLQIFVTRLEILLFVKSLFSSIHI